jgi:signal peptidase II
VRALRRGHSREIEGMKKKYWVFAIFFLFALGADQATKIWARASLKPRHEVITVIPNYFDLRYSENEGSAFGLFRGMPGARYLLFAVGIVALVVVISFLRKAGPDQTRVAGELGLLAGGAVGNIIDRVAFGRVTDFILWKIHSHEWPVFNIADAALVVGVIALLLDGKWGQAAEKAEGKADGKADGKKDGDKEKAAEAETKPAKKGRGKK